MNSSTKRLSKAISFFIYLIPIFYIVYGVIFSIEPVEKLLETTGFSSINLLMISVLSAIIRHFRIHRLLTVFARHAGYASLIYGLSHLAIYLVLDQGLSMIAIMDDIVKHPRLIAGSFALLGLILAGFAGLTTIKKRPALRKSLLRMSYPAGILAGYHYMEAVKYDRTVPIIYVCLFVLIITVRFLVIFRRRKNRS